MGKERLDERFLKIAFIDNINGLLVDINNEYQWEHILTQKDKIIKIESTDWVWNLLSNEVMFQ